MSSFRIPLEEVAAYGQAFRWTLRDLTAADNRVRAATKAFEDRKRHFDGKAWARLLDRREPTVQELLHEKLNGRTRDEAEEEAALRPFRLALEKAQAEREGVRQELVGLAAKLIEGSIDLGIQDTTALTVFRQTWDQQDLLMAVALVENLSARAWLAMKDGDLLAVVTRSLDCLARLQGVEADWWRLKMSPPSSGLNPTFGPDGKPTQEHLRRADAFLAALANKKAELERRRDDLREELKKLGDPLMAVAVRPEVNLQPSRLRNLFHGWNPHVSSDPDLVTDARNFLCDLQLKLQDPRTASAMVRADAAPTQVATDQPTSVQVETAKGGLSDAVHWQTGDVYELLTVGRKIRQVREGMTAECDLSPLHFRICNFFHRRASATVRELMNKTDADAPWARRYVVGRGDKSINTETSRLSTKLEKNGFRVEFTRKGENVIRSIR
jgi:hypothetical protein